MTSRSVILSILIMLALAVAVKLTAPRSGSELSAGPDLGPIPAAGLTVGARTLAPSGIAGLDTIWLWSEGGTRVPVAVTEAVRAWDQLRAGLIAGAPSAEAFVPAVTIGAVGAKAGQGGPIVELSEPFAGRVLARAAGKVWSISPGAAGAWLSTAFGSENSPLMVVPATAFDRARLESPAKTIGLAQTQGQWMLEAPVATRADDGYCVEMLRRIASIPAEREVRGSEAGAPASGAPALMLVLGSALPDGSRLEQSIEITTAADRQGQEYFAVARAERVSAEGTRAEAWSPRTVTIARARIERLSAEPADYLPATPVRALAGDVRSVRWGETEFVRAGENWSADGKAAAIDRAEALKEIVELATRVAAGAKAVGTDVPASAVSMMLRDATGATMGELRVWASGSDETPTVSIAAGPARWIWPAERARVLRKQLETP
ncbi:MAG: hypothetical protein SFY95_12475 [Planctomycetota bacterium]|nr:hypothetical protein [Planctomycetota bacterium]